MGRTIWYFKEIEPPETLKRNRILYIEKNGLSKISRRQTSYQLDNFEQL